MTCICFLSVVKEGKVKCQSLHSAQFWTNEHVAAKIMLQIIVTEDIVYYDYQPVTLLFACFISFQCYALS